MRNTYPIGTPLTFVWRFQNPDGSPIVFVPTRFHFALRYTAGRGEKIIETFAVTPDGDGITWTFPAKDQHVLGTFDLVLDIFLDGRLIEHYYYRKAFTLFQSAKGTINTGQYQEGATVNLLSVGEFYHFMTGEVINTPDEEDLTSDSRNLLRFKDRDGSDGMGYVILRKNKSFSEQVIYENTIYEIRYDFDLDGESVTIPDGCVLKFNGGVLANGSIVGNETSIDSLAVQIFGSDATVGGSWNIAAAYPEWFGAKGDGITDDRAALQATTDAFTTMVLAPKTYLIDSVNNTTDKIGIMMSQGHRIIGSEIQNTVGEAGLARCTIKIGQSLDILSAIKLVTCCELSNIGINLCGTNENFSSVSSAQCWGLRINGVCVGNSRTAFNLSCFLSTITQCVAAYCTTGFYIHGANGIHNTSTTLIGCYAVDCIKNGYKFSYMNYSSAISCAADQCGNRTSTLDYVYYLDHCDSMVFESCGCERCLKAIYAELSQGIRFLNCHLMLDKGGYIDLPDSFTLTDIVYVKYCAHISIDDCGFYLATLNDYIEENGRLVCIYGDSSQGQYIMLTFKASPVAEASKLIKRQNIQNQGTFDMNTALSYIDINNYRTVGNTSSRPTFTSGTMAGFEYYDTSLNKPVFWNGSAWKDAAGTSV